MINKGSHRAALFYACKKQSVFECYSDVSIDTEYRMNIFLIGSMGAGKSTIGRQLAKRLKRPFYDSDHVLVERCGVDIPTIFEFEGESGFRDRESQIIDELSRQDNIVLATGGGAVLRPENRKMLAARGTVIYLRVSLKNQYQRTSNSRNRPLLQGDNLMEKLQKLRDERDPLYNALADHILDSDNRTPNRIVKAIQRKLEHPRPKHPDRKSRTSHENTTRRAR